MPLPHKLLLAATLTLLPPAILTGCSGGISKGAPETGSGITTGTGNSGSGSSSTGSSTGSGDSGSGSSGSSSSGSSSSSSTGSGSSGTGSSGAGSSSGSGSGGSSSSGSSGSGSSSSGSSGSGSGSGSSSSSSSSSSGSGSSSSSAGSSGSGSNGGGSGSYTSGGGSGTPGTGSGILRGVAQTGPSSVAGAHIYLYAANTAFYGAPSIPLLDPSLPGVSSDSRGTYVTTDGSGAFTLTGLYHCTPGQQVYLLALGGTPVGKPFNPYLALLTTFGTCPASGDFSQEISFININQVSTVVTAFALSGFMTDASHVSSGTSQNSQAGLAHAFAAVGSLMDIGTGVAYQYTSGQGVIPQPKINTLANIITPCSDDPSACPALFAATTAPGAPAPTDTVLATLAISQSPALHVAALYGLVGDQPFRPALSYAPTDWTLGITFYAINMVGPYFPAVDGSGNLWVPGYGNNTLTEFDPLGNILSGDSGFSGGGLVEPVSAAFDPSGNLWVTSYGGNTGTLAVVSEFASNGYPITSNGFQCGTKCTGLALDNSSRLWVSGTPNTNVLKNSGQPLDTFPAVGGSAGIAVDSQGRGWTVTPRHTLARLSLPNNILEIPEGVTSRLPEFNAVAIDAYDDIWFTSPNNNALGEFYINGNSASPTSGYTGGGLAGPVGLAIDGSGRVWVANRDGNSVSAFTNDGIPLSPATGFQCVGFANPRGIAIDPSGNVWVTNFTANAVTELLGAATPVSTPILPGNHGQRP